MPKLTSSLDFHFFIILFWLFFFYQYNYFLPLLNHIFHFSRPSFYIPSPPPLSSYLSIESFSIHSSISLPFSSFKPSDHLTQLHYNISQYMIGPFHTFFLLEIYELRFFLLCFSSFFFFFIFLCFSH